MDLAEAHSLLQALRDEAACPRLEIVSGSGDSEVWKETSAQQLPHMFQEFRKILTAQLAKRFSLDTTPDVCTLLALKMHPAINTLIDGPALTGKQAKAEIMQGEYIRALRRQGIRLHGAPGDPVDVDAAPTDATSATPADATPADVAPANVAPANAAVPTAEAPTATAHGKPPTPTKPPGKRRKGLLGAVAAAQATPTPEPRPDESSVDVAVAKEIDEFDLISRKILANPLKCAYYQNKEKDRFNLKAFWADHKQLLPLHYSVFITEVGPCKAGAANIETVFSGVGKFTEEARSSGPVLLRQMARLHYNWKYSFLRPTTKEVVERYNAKHHPPAPAAPELTPEPTLAEPTEIAGVA